MGLPGCLFVCHLILLLVCFLFNYNYYCIKNVNAKSNTIRINLGVCFGDPNRTRS